MEVVNVVSQQKSLFLQRNILIVISSILLLSVLFLSIHISSVDQKIILTPASLSKDVAIEGENYSHEYLEEMTLFFVPLFLDLTPENIAHKSSIILRYTDPNNRNAIKEYFAKEVEKYKEYNLSTTFKIKSITIKGNVAEIEGILLSKFGSDGQKEQQTTFQIEYSKSHNGMQIVSFKAKDGAKND